MHGSPKNLQAIWGCFPGFQGLFGKNFVDLHHQFFGNYAVRKPVEYAGVMKWN